MSDYTAKPVGVPAAVGSTDRDINWGRQTDRQNGAGKRGRSAPQLSEQSDGSEL